MWVSPLIYMALSPSIIIITIIMHGSSYIYTTMSSILKKVYIILLHAVKVTEKRCSCPTVTITACLSTDRMEYTVFHMQSKVIVTVITPPCNDLFKRRFKETETFVDMVKAKAADGNDYHAICTTIINGK